MGKSASLPNCPNLHNQRAVKQGLVENQIDASKRSNGFLVGTLDRNQIVRFLNRNGVLYVAQEIGIYIGYLLITPIQEFLGYFSPGYQSETSTHQEKAVFKPLADHKILEKIKNDLFVYHVAVDAAVPRGGIGSELMFQVIRDFPNTGLVADVLTGPILNRPSISFFKKHGFEEVGSIDYYRYKNFGDLTTLVLRRDP